MNMKILLSFDLEEFDVLADFSIEKQLEQTNQGLLKLIKMLDKNKIKVTFFVTHLFVKHHPNIVKALARKGHEIACHGFHSDNYLDIKKIEKLGKAKKELEELGIKVKGFRAPRFQIRKVSMLKKFGFEYDSSLHPTLMPGRYMNLFKKRKIHNLGGVVEIPPSVLPFLRFPIAWFAFKNFGPLYPKIFTKLNSLFSNYTLLVFHLWEFSDLRSFKLSIVIKRKNGEELLKMLENYIVFCKNQGYKFETISKYLKLS